MKPIQFIAIKTVWVEIEWASKIGHFKYRTEKKKHRSVREKKRGNDNNIFKNAK